MENKKIKPSWKVKFKKLVHNPWLDFSVGIILALSSLVEIFDTFPKELADFKLGAHHGVFLLGIATLLKAAASMIAGLEFVDEGEIIEDKKK